MSSVKIQIAERKQKINSKLTCNLLKVIIIGLIITSTINFSQNLAGNNDGTDKVTATNNVSNMKNNNISIDRISIMNLENSNINQIPDYIFRCTNLESLNLRNNDIMNLPIEIRVFYKLRILDLTNTKIEELPEEISQLKLLKELHLSYELWQYRLDELHKITKAQIILE